MRTGTILDKACFADADDRLACERKIGELVHELRSQQQRWRLVHGSSNDAAIVNIAAAAKDQIELTLMRAGVA